jgi:hypothetical protein
MKTLSALAFAALLGASSLAVTASNALARVVCNEDGDAGTLIPTTTMPRALA